MRIGTIVGGLLLGLSVSAIPAKPSISVNKTVYDADTVFEGAKDAVSYTFKIRNNGDEPLVIRSVRPG